jgi:hypothetical protein
MTKQVKDMGASVRGRLRRLARASGESFAHVLLRYANERLLYRLASSSHGPRFVLKGAALFTLWTGKPHRATRDLDLLGYGPSDVGDMRAVFEDVLSPGGIDDGVRFDAKNLVVAPIREDQEYGGVRVELVAWITTAQVRLQVDVGVGDAITPEASLMEFPVILDFPAPRLRAYPRETVVAEKVEAMVQLGMANSRMKDFYDVALLARTFDFEGELLTRAMVATFERRKTAVPNVPPVAFTEAFATDPTKRVQWSGFVRKAGVGQGASLLETVASVRGFAEAPLLAAAQGVALRSFWRAGGGWV